MVDSTCALLGYIHGQEERGFSNTTMIAETIQDTTDLEPSSQDLLQNKFKKDKSGALPRDPERNLATRAKMATELASLPHVDKDSLQFPQNWPAFPNDFVDL